MEDSSNSGSSEESRIVVALLACLEQILFKEHKLSGDTTSRNHDRLVVTPKESGNNTPEQYLNIPVNLYIANLETFTTSELVQADKILKRFRNGELLQRLHRCAACTDCKNSSVLNPGAELSSSYQVNSNNVTKPDTINYGVMEKPTTTLRRPFRPPSRKPASEVQDVEPPSNDIFEERVESTVPCKIEGLFTTHSQVSSSSVKPSSTSFTFGCHKRFQSNTRALVEKRSFFFKKKPPLSEEDDAITSVPLYPSSSNSNGVSGSTEPQAQTKGHFKSAYEFMVTEDKARGIKRTLPPPPSILGDSSVHKIPKLAATKNGTEEGISDNPEVNLLMTDERLKNVEPKMVEAILNEVVEIGASTDWNDIAGLEGVKAIIREIIIWPMQRPDLFTGLRGPPKGILLFGPPGTGKTMFGRLIATKSSSTFFNISASSLMSKWCGDGEKMVRALFQVARVKQPSVIFIDEIDSILTQRSDSEHETSRRLKTEFLIQFDGCATKSEDKLLVIGVTNRPQELDEAARRRLVKRVYIPLPEANGRKQLVRNLLADQNTSLEDEDYENVASLTDGYSGADMASLCKEAAYGPIRDIGHDIENVQLDKVRPIQLLDFENALKHVKASVANSDLTLYETWDKQFGCHV